MKTKQILDNFWHSIIIEARDSVIDDTRQVLNGQSKDLISSILYNKLSESFQEESSIKAIEELVIDRIDMLLQTMLISFDECSDIYGIIAKVGNKKVEITGVEENSSVNYLNAIDNYSRYRQISDIVMDNALGKIER